MGLISEICEEAHAKDLFVVIRAALDSKNADVIKFTHEFIVPLATAAVSESFNQELRETLEQLSTKFFIDSPK